jgi:rhodanese-related sulfurtransferase
LFKQQLEHTVRALLRSTLFKQSLEYGGVMVGIVGIRDEGLGNSSWLMDLDAGEVPVGPVIAHCMHGQRSMTAASVLERAGRDDVAVFTGGPDQWTGDSSA